MQRAERCGWCAAVALVGGVTIALVPSAAGAVAGDDPPTAITVEAGSGEAKAQFDTGGGIETPPLPPPPPPPDPGIPAPVQVTPQPPGSSPPSFALAPAGEKETSLVSADVGPVQVQVAQARVNDDGEGGSSLLVLNDNPVLTDRDVAGRCGAAAGPASVRCLEGGTDSSGRPRAQVAEVSAGPVRLAVGSIRGRAGDVAAGAQSSGRAGAIGRITAGDSAGGGALGRLAGFELGSGTGQRGLFADLSVGAVVGALARTGLEPLRLVVAALGAIAAGLAAMALGRRPHQRPAARPVAHAAGQAGAGSSRTRVR